MKRSLLLIIATVIFLALLGWAFYFLRVRQGTTSAPPEQIGGLPNITLPPGSPTPSSGNISPPSPPASPQNTSNVFGQVTQSPVLSYFVDPTNTAAFIAPDGQIAELRAGNVTSLSSLKISNLQNAWFSSDGQKILAALGNLGNTQMSVFDLKTKTWQPLPEGIEAAAWSPSGNTLAYLLRKGDLVSLTTLDMENAKAKPVVLLSFHEEDFSLAWPTSSQLLLFDKGNAFAGGSLWSFDIKKKLLAPILQKQLGLQILWSAKNQGLVFTSTKTQTGGRLAIIHEQGNTVQNFNFLTLPSKCAFKPDLKPAVPSGTSTIPAATSSQPVLYCAIPRDEQGFTNSSLPDAYARKEFFTADDIYEITLSSGNIRPLFTDSAYAVDAEGLRIFNGKLFFINRLDQKLYGITLPAE